MRVSSYHDQRLYRFDEKSRERTKAGQVFFRGSVESSVRRDRASANFCVTYSGRGAD